MWCLCVVLVVLTAIADESLANKERNNKMAEILDSLKRIEDHITKEDRLREIADVIRIDANVDKLNIKMDQLLSLLDPRAGGTVGRFGSSSSEVAEAGIEARLRSLEASVNGVEETVKKLDFDSGKVNEIERRTTQLKDDMNAKLRKMMNVLTALYELNKEMKTFAEGRGDTSEQSAKGEAQPSNLATEFLVENLEEMERKIKEQFSILTSEIRSEVTSLKIVASSAGADCQTAASNDEEDWMTPNMARSGGRQSALTSLVETLGRSTREIRQDIQQGMQEIDSKLENLTTIAQSQPSCGDPLTAAASVSQITARRTVMPFSAKSEQELVANSRRAKADTCTKSVQNVPNPKSCADLRKGGATCDGIYVVFIKGRRAVRVFCDMNTDGGGWTLLMRRGDYGDKMTSFDRNWMSYKNGFGDAEGEFWLGNDVMHHMTSDGEPNALRIHLSSFDGDHANLDYSSFSVGNESSLYRLKLGPPATPSSNAANSFMYHNNHPFSTSDRKNDNFEQNCAATYKGGWWFNGCYFGFLTGEYFRLEEKRENWEGILWYDWKKNAALKGAEMMIRPKNFAA